MAVVFQLRRLKEKNDHMEPRISVISERMKNVQRIIAVASGKGGVGKSMVASTLAASLADEGNKVGLLDLDLYGPSSHIILGVKPIGFPDEDNGIDPFEVAKMKFMSIVYFTQDKPGAFRGGDITNIIIELLAITQWKDLEYLIIDMPPGIGDEILDILSYIPQAEFLVVTTPSKVAMGAVEKLLKILKEFDADILGVTENMKQNSSSYVHDILMEMDVEYLGAIRFDQTVEDAIGKPDQFSSTDFSKDLKEIIRKIGFTLY